MVQNGRRCIAIVLVIGLVLWGCVQLALMLSTPEQETEEWYGWRRGPHSKVTTGKSDSMQDSVCELATGHCAAINSTHDALSESSAAKLNTSAASDEKTGAKSDNLTNGSVAKPERLDHIGLHDFDLFHSGIDGSRYGRGVSIVDIDNDGWDDVWLCAAPINGSLPGRSMAWRNIGNGQFVPWHTLLPNEVDAQYYGNWGSAWFDFDNDGDLDLVLANGGYETEPSLPVLLQNMLVETGQAVLHDVSSALGWPGAKSGTSPHSLFQIWWGVAAVDFNNDGFSDFIITHTSSHNHLQDWRDKVPDSQRPELFANGLRRPWALFQNMQNGTFVDVSRRLLPYGTKWAEHGHNELKNPVWLDVNLDGSPDLFIAASPALHFVYDPAIGRFVNATSKLLWEGRSHEISPQMARQFQRRLVFAACVADFNQDGFDDLYLGYWTMPDLVMTGGPDGRLASAFVVDKKLRGALHKSNIMDKRYQVESAGFDPDRQFENTMGLACGDLNHDGFPEAFIGTGTPAWGNYDVAVCNMGNVSGSWQGLQRCEQGSPEAGVLGQGHGQTRTHGIALGDLNGDGVTDLVFNNGGFATSDLDMPADLQVRLDENEDNSDKKTNKTAWLARRNNCTWPPPRAATAAAQDVVCDTRETVSVYSVAPETAKSWKNRTAYVRLIGFGGQGGSNKDALGARLTLRAGRSWRRHATVHSAQGFNSQNSAWIPLVLGRHKQGQVEIQWPSGQRTTHLVQGGSRQTLVERSA